MEKAQNEIKKENVGADGLTKKGRKSQKVNREVNARQSQDTSKLTVQNLTSSDISNNLKTTNKSLNIENSKKNSNEDSSSKGITEKELRRLEWAKKTELSSKGDKEIEKNVSKADLKAKRREQQEAQRQKKIEQVAKSAPKPTAGKEGTSKPESKKKDEVNKTPEKKFIPKKETRKPTESHKVQLVQHLYNEKLLKIETKILAVHPEIHPVFIKLGVQYSKQIVLGSNARCLALLAALKYVVDDLKSPPKQEFCRYLENVLQNSATHLHSCRPLAVSMMNALRYFKLQLTQINTNLKDSEKKAKLQEIIDTYIHDDIRKASDAISMKVREKISNGDVILTFGCSSLITKILLEAQNDGKKFKVIIVDGRPLLEGRELLRRLVVAGLNCSYILINAISYVMTSVTKVVLGAHAILTNGYVMSRIGTAQVALVAREYNKPVLVCCETYKFSERVQTDSFVYNEIGDPDKLSVTHVNKTSTSLSKWKDMPKLTPLNLLYDITPPDLITAVVTEIAILPCTSVPVVLRINASETA